MKKSAGFPLGYFFLHKALVSIPFPLFSKVKQIILDNRPSFFSKRDKEFFLSLFITADSRHTINRAVEMRNMNNMPFCY